MSVDPLLAPHSVLGRARMSILEFVHFLHGRQSVQLNVMPTVPTVLSSFLCLAVLGPVRFFEVWSIVVGISHPPRNPATHHRC